MNVINSTVVHPIILLCNKLSNKIMLNEVTVRKSGGDIVGFDIKFNDIIIKLHRAYIMDRKPISLSDVGTYVSGYSIVSEGYVDYHIDDVSEVGVHLGYLFEKCVDYTNTDNKIGELIFKLGN